MAILLFRLRNVPDDEAEEVRTLLRDNGIAFYETSPGNWGISAPALWLPDADQQALAQQLLADYQTARYLKARAAYQQAQADGSHPGFWTSLRHQPLRVLYGLVSLLILYVSCKWVFEFGS